MTIVTCPACRTRFRVDERALGGPAGRDVRCANCGHTWHQAPPGAGSGTSLVPSRGEAPVMDAPPPAPAPSLVVPPRRQPPPLLTSRQVRHGRTAPALTAAIVLVSLLALAVVIGIAGRGRVVAAWPSAARLYAWVGSFVEPAGPGLVIGKVAPTRAADGLMIDGEIANLGSAPRDVPRLRLALQDATEKEVQFEIVDPPKSRLQPGDVVHFSIPFSHPVEVATGVVVTFAPP
jgi:predicted Zn finger-like uncharacterized protein